MAADVPVVGDLMDLKETFWLNPGLWPASEALAACPLTRADVEDAAARLERFAPYIKKVFPQTEAAGGIIESPLVPIPHMRKALGGPAGTASA